MKCPKPIKKAKVKKKVIKKRKGFGLSDSHLLHLRREVVKKLFGGCCFFCGLPHQQVEIEDHHYAVKRNMFLLRYDWRNGLPVCKYGCHQNAETPHGKHLINNYILEQGFMEYLQERSGNCKEWLLKHNMTKTDYKRFMYDDLKAKLKELQSA